MIDSTELARAFRHRCGALEGQLHPLADKPKETVANTLRALWHLAAGKRLSVEAAAITALPALSDAAERRLTELISLRLSGIPLAHLTGRERFMGVELLSTNDALIPRRETELVGRAALEQLYELCERIEHPRVIDVCTGCGNLAVALAYHVSRARLFASDISSDAVQLARRNAAHLELAGRIEFRIGDLLEPFNEAPFRGTTDMIVCNPPYISTGKVGTMAPEISAYEPRLAFDGGALGISVLNRLIREAPQYLAPGGWLAIEVGLGQGDATIRRIRHAGAFETVRGVADDHGDTRVVIARTAEGATA